MDKKIIKLIAKTLELKEKDIKPETRLTQDLEIDSLDLVDLVAAFEEEFNIEIADQDIKKLQTVHDIIEYANQHQADA
ncbi:acyl carrier protein [Candidatus Saccharibacteria bacterium]|nr:acyl carrier protein [Candidatus Saccharibacteria bacterium]